jgi:hypothetical protein
MYKNNDSLQVMPHMHTVLTITFIVGVAVGIVNSFSANTPNKIQTTILITIDIITYYSYETSILIL